MACAFHNGVRIYWEEDGAGPPLLMIMGLSFSLAMWGELRPFLAEHFRTLLFDNRCVGKSASPLGPFSIATMAGDAVAVLDAAGVCDADVIGFSMGGMIAQELALRYPSRVRRLVLGCTHCGGRHAQFADWSVIHTLASPFMRPETKLQRMVPLIYDAGTPEEAIAYDLALIRQHAPSLRGYAQQLAAILSWRSWKRLPCITAPTLVIHGENDRLVPPVNARILSERIPGAQLVLLPNAGHVFPTDQPAATRQALSDFLLRDESRAA